MGQGHVYLPILFLGLLAFGFAAFSVAAATFTGPKRYNRAKVDAYECGIQAVAQNLHGARFPVKYYLTAMLFIVFDIEIVFLYPIAVNLKMLGEFGFAELVVFVAILAVGYVYVWKKGALEWH